MVDKAEQLLLDLGFHQVRVRIPNDEVIGQINPVFCGFADFEIVWYDKSTTK